MIANQPRSAGQERQRAELKVGIGRQPRPAVHEAGRPQRAEEHHLEQRVLSVRKHGAFAAT